jgi:hypothetical protein
MSNSTEKLTDQEMEAVRVEIENFFQMIYRRVTMTEVEKLTPLEMQDLKTDIKNVLEMIFRQLDYLSQHHCNFQTGKSLGVLEPIVIQTESQPREINLDNFDE